jgi:hypothetical protein
MLGSPFNFEQRINPVEFQKLGELTMRWSHIHHIVGNCLKTMLRLTDEEAAISVFPLGFEGRLAQINKLSELQKLNSRARAALDALNAVATHINTVRNTVVHAIIVDDPELGKVLHLRSKRRVLTLEQVFSVEELTNYVARVALALRVALDDEPAEHFPLPDKPSIPRFLNHPNPTGIRLGPGRKSPPRSSLP